jgi:DNA polymerase III alpha subunit (gram-positive type)
MPATLIYVDLETTGFSFRLDEIIEIGACVENGTVFNILIKPTTPISHKIQKLTHITNDMLKKYGKTPYEACMLFTNYLNKFENVILVGHNMYKFDMPFILNLFRKFGIIDVLPFNGIIDTLLLMRKIKVLKKNSLGHVYTHIFNKPIHNAHRAHYDALAVQAIVESPWFQKKFPLFLQNVIRRNEMFDNYWERFLRLNHHIKYQKYCPICKGSISAFFVHYH